MAGNRERGSRRPKYDTGDIRRALADTFDMDPKKVPGSWVRITRSLLIAHFELGYAGNEMNGATGEVHERLLFLERLDHSPEVDQEVARVSSVYQTFQRGQEFDSRANTQLGQFLGLYGLGKFRQENDNRLKEMFSDKPKKP